MAARQSIAIGPRVPACAASAVAGPVTRSPSSGSAGQLRRGAGPNGDTRRSAAALSMSMLPVTRGRCRLELVRVPSPENTPRRTCNGKSRQAEWRHSRTSMPSRPGWECGCGPRLTRAAAVPQEYPNQRQHAVAYRDVCGARNAWPAAPLGYSPPPSRSSFAPIVPSVRSSAVSSAGPARAPRQQYQVGTERRLAARCSPPSVAAPGNHAAGSSRPETLRGIVSDTVVQQRTVAPISSCSKPAFVPAAPAPRPTAPPPAIRAGRLTGSGSGERQIGQRQRQGFSRDLTGYRDPGIRPSHPAISKVNCPPGAQTCQRRGRNGPIPRWPSAAVTWASSDIDPSPSQAAVPPSPACSSKPRCAGVPQT